MMGDVQTISSDEEEDEEDIRPTATPGWFHPSSLHDVNKSSLAEKSNDGTEVAQDNRWTNDFAHSRKRERLSDQDSSSASRKRPHIRNSPTGSKLPPFPSVQHTNQNLAMNHPNPGFSVISRADPEGPSRVDQQRNAFQEPARHSPFHFFLKNNVGSSPEREVNPPELDATSPVFHTRRRPSQLTEPVEVSSSDESGEDSFIWTSSQMVAPPRISHERKKSETPDVILSDDDDEVAPSQIGADRFIDSFYARTAMGRECGNHDRGNRTLVGNCSTDTVVRSVPEKECTAGYKAAITGKASEILRLNPDNSCVRRSVASDIPPMRDPMSVGNSGVFLSPQRGTHSLFKIPVIVADCTDKSHTSCRSFHPNVIPLSSAARPTRLQVPSPPPSPIVLSECREALKDAIKYHASDGCGELKTGCNVRDFVDEMRRAAEEEQSRELRGESHPVAEQRVPNVAPGSRTRRWSLSWDQSNSESQSVLGGTVLDQKLSPSYNVPGATIAHPVPGNPRLITGNPHQIQSNSHQISDCPRSVTKLSLSYNVPSASNANLISGNPHSVSGNPFLVTHQKLSPSYNTVPSEPIVCPVLGNPHSTSGNTCQIQGNPRPIPDSHPVTNQKLGQSYNMPSTSISRPVPGNNHQITGNPRPNPGYPHPVTNQKLSPPHNVPSASNNAHPTPGVCVGVQCNRARKASDGDLFSDDDLFDDYTMTQCDEVIARTMQASSAIDFKKPFNSAPQKIATGCQTGATCNAVVPATKSIASPLYSQQDDCIILKPPQRIATGCQTEATCDASATKSIASPLYLQQDDCIVLKPPQKIATGCQTEATCDASATKSIASPLYLQQDDCIVLKPPQKIATGCQTEATCDASATKSIASQLYLQQDDCIVLKPPQKIATGCQTEATCDAAATKSIASPLYSQQDDCIILSDSDDEIFANLTQAVMNPMVLRNSDDDDDETVDDGWNDDDDDMDAAMMMLDESCFVVAMEKDEGRVEPVDHGVKSEWCERRVSAEAKVEDGGLWIEVEPEGAGYDVQQCQEMSLVRGESIRKSRDHDSDAKSYGEVEFESEEMEYMPQRRQISIIKEEEDVNETRDFDTMLKSPGHVPRLPDHVPPRPPQFAFTRGDPEVADTHGQVRRVVGMIAEQASDPEEDDIPIGELIKKQKVVQDRKRYTSVKPLPKQKRFAGDGGAKGKFGFDAGTDSDEDEDANLPRFDMTKACLLLRKDLNIRSAQEILEVEIDEDTTPVCADAHAHDLREGRVVESGKPLDFPGEVESDAEDEENYEIRGETKVTRVNYLESDELEKSELVLRYYNFTETGDQCTETGDQRMETGNQRTETGNQRTETGDQWMSKASPPTKLRVRSVVVVSPRKRRPGDRSRKRADAVPEKRKKRSVSEDQGQKIAQLRESRVPVKKKVLRAGLDNKGGNQESKIEESIRNAKNVMRDRAKQVERENKERIAAGETSSRKGKEPGKLKDLGKGKEPGKVTRRRKTLPATLPSAEKVGTGSAARPAPSSAKHGALVEASTSSRADISVLDAILGPVTGKDSGVRKTDAKRPGMAVTARDHTLKKHSNVADKVPGAELLGVFKQPTARSEKSTTFRIPRLSCKETVAPPAAALSPSASAGAKDLIGASSGSIGASEVVASAKDVAKHAVVSKDPRKAASKESNLKRKPDGLVSEVRSDSVKVNSAESLPLSVSSKHSTSKPTASVAPESSMSSSSRCVPVPPGGTALPPKSSSVASKSSMSNAAKSSARTTSKLLPDTIKSSSSVPSKSESSKFESSKSALSKSESSKSELSKSELSKSELSKSESSKSDTLKSDTSKSDTSKSDSLGKPNKSLALPSKGKNADPPKTNSASTSSVTSLKSGSLRADREKMPTSKSDNKSSGTLSDPRKRVKESDKRELKNDCVASTESNATGKSRPESARTSEALGYQQTSALTDVEISLMSGIDKLGGILVATTSLEEGSTVPDKLDNVATSVDVEQPLSSGDKHAMQRLDGTKKPTEKQSRVALDATVVADVAGQTSKVQQQKPLSDNERHFMQPPDRTLTTAENQSKTSHKPLDNKQILYKRKPVENQSDTLPPVNDRIENQSETANKPTDNPGGGNSTEAKQTASVGPRFAEPALPTALVRPLLELNAKRGTAREVVRTTAPALGREVESITLSQIVNDSIRKTGPMPSPLLSEVAPRKRVLADVSGHSNKPPPESESRKLTDFPRAKVDVSSVLPMDNLTSTILFWNPVWMKECETVKFPPPIVNYDKVYPLLDTYDSFADYADILQPLMLLEMWESMIKDWKENQRNRQRSCKVIATYLRIEKERMHMFLHCQGVIRQNESNMRESDLVIVNLRSLPVSPKGQAAPDPSLTIVKPVFGIVSKVTRHIPGKTQEPLHPRIEELKKSIADRCSIITYIIEFAYRKQPIDNSEFISIEPVTSILSTLRQFSGLANLPRSTLAAEILRPTQWEVFHHNMEIGANQLKDRFNPSQRDAISKIAKAVLDPYFPPKICLLQGPPGTGKSHTVIGLVEHLLAQNSNFHILLCAPSNAGLDELCRRLIACNRLERPGSRKGISFVRLGVMKSIHADVQPYSLQIQAKKKYEQQQKSAPTSVQSTLMNLEQKQREWKAKLDKCLKENDTNEIEIARKELRMLEKRKESISGGLSKPMSAAEDVRMKKEVVMGVDVVCATLNHSGSKNIVDMMLYQDATKHHFGCVIVDEACQCTEVDCLIPLQYRSSKLVLVGDPEQLPPTVLSKKAGDMRYGQSLFERLYNQLKPAPSSNQSNPVLMLQTQYRMHEEICDFSSRHFYYGLLKTNPGTAKKRSQFRSSPFSVFDLQYTNEKSDQRSLSTYNPDEADFVVQLCQHLASWMTAEKAVENIGIITPYQSQKNLIAALLNQRCRKLSTIEVGTVDGFQGREKDVMIVSCVRANSQRNIGFLADRRRMNVSLTRAKYALYIVGHMKTLTSNADWSALVTDAQHRGRLVKVATAQQSPSQIQHGCSKS